jgi:AcrR family transcriptional regulator
MHPGEGTLSEQLRSKHGEMMTLALEGVALRLFDERGFADVTVDEIAAQAHISVRTFYRYFSTKEQLLQVRIDQRSMALTAALAARPDDEALPLSLRTAFTQVFEAEDPELLRCWIAVIETSRELIPGVLGGVHLKVQTVVAAFLARRSGLGDDAVAPRMLAAAISGVVQASLFRWFTGARDLPSALTEGLGALELFGRDPSSWEDAIGPVPSPLATRSPTTTSR